MSKLIGLWLHSFCLLNLFLSPAAKALGTDRTVRSNSIPNLGHIIIQGTGGTSDRLIQYVGKCDFDVFGTEECSPDESGPKSTDVTLVELQSQTVERQGSYFSVGRMTLYELIVTDREERRLFWQQYRLVLFTNFGGSLTGARLLKLRDGKVGEVFPLTVTSH
jgi:hypothetical protein